MTSELTALAVGAAVAGFVQGVAGFAFGLVAMSIWVWMIDPKLAAVMAIFGGLTGQLLSAMTLRRGLHLRLLLPFLAGGAVGIPMGVAALAHIDATQFKLALGSVLVLFCPAMILAPSMPRITRGGRLGDAAAGLVGGILGGIGGFTGIAPALWCSLRGYSKDQHRAVLQNFNLAALAATLLTLILSGKVSVDMLPKFAVLAPALVIPSLIGSRVYLGLSPAVFRKLVLALLALAGLAMIAASLANLSRT